MAGFGDYHSNHVDWKQFKTMNCLFSNKKCIFSESITRTMNIFLLISTLSDEYYITEESRKSKREQKGTEKTGVKTRVQDLAGYGIIYAL